MSYCRWSTDDFQCDVYVYENISGGWTTHVAGNRVVWGDKLPPQIDASWAEIVESKELFDEWMGRHLEIMEMIKNVERVPIGLPYDGQTFNDPTPGACAVRLASLKAMGYNVPQDVIDQLADEGLDYKEVQVGDDQTTGQPAADHSEDD